MHKGTLYAIAAYLAWGLFPIYFKSLHEVAALEILLNRMIWALVFLLGVLAWRKQWSWIPLLLTRPRVVAGFAASATLLSVNWLIYIWAINNGHIIDASLGYFITPLVNIVIGFAVLRERLAPLQWLSVGLAAAGVAWLGWQSGHLPWIGVGLALSFGTYGLLRKTSALGALEGLSLETFLLFPFAFAYLAWLGAHGQSSLTNGAPHLRLLLIASGPITAVPLLLFAAGARRITMTTLGILQYIAPFMQFAIGVWLYQEYFDSQRLLGFATIWLALIVYSCDSLWRTLKTQRA